MLTKKKPTRKSSVATQMLKRLSDFADALESGEDISKRFTRRRVELKMKPLAFSPEDVKKTRLIFGASQAMFAKFLGVKAKTVQAWEQGLCTPGDMACRFMEEIRDNPDYWVKRFQRSIVPRTS